ncbi:dockerin type I repeat-containing protein [bacterium]|nr:dockerin type I repeat-containing protein [bacterium]
MSITNTRWYFITAVLVLLFTSACGGGGAQEFLSADNDRGFSLATDQTADGGSAHFSINVLEQADSTEVQVSAGNARDLTQLLLHLNYDASRYSPSSQSTSGLLGEEGELLTLAVDSEPGVLHYGVVSTTGEGFNGSGLLASLKFDNQPLDPARALSSPPALGNAAAEIEYNNLSGQISWFYANPGDTNQDGLVNLADLVPIARDYMAAGPFGISSRQSVADANADGEVNISDVSVLGANWNNDAFGGFNVYSSDIEGAQGSPVGNVAFANAVGDPAAERLRFSYMLPSGSRNAYAWVQPVDGAGMAGLSGDSIFSDIVISGPTASFGNKTEGGDGTSGNPFVVNSGEVMPFVVYDPEDGDITGSAGLSMWLEPTVAGTLSGGMLNVSDSYNGNFVMRGSYQGEDVQLLATTKTSSGLGTGNGDGAFFQIDGCLELHLDAPELDGNGSIWNPYIVDTAGASLDFSVWHCDFGDISDSENLSWGWQPENAGEFNWDIKGFTFFEQFTGLWVIEVAWEHEGMVASDHLYFIVDPSGGGSEAELALKVLDGFEDGAGTAENPYIICDTTHEFGLKAWHSELGDVTQNEHLIWHVNPEAAGMVHPEWHQFNVAEGFLGNFYIEIVWETENQRLVAKKYFKVQQCETGGKVFEIKVGEGVSGGTGTQEDPYQVCIDEVWEFYLKAWHEEYGDVTEHGDTTWSWSPENAGAVHPEWHQFNMAEGFTGPFSIHAVHHRQGQAWEDTKYFKALECGGTENYIEIKVTSGYVDGNGGPDNPYIICNDTWELGVKGWHSVLEDITQNEHTTWIVDSPNAGIMHPEWHQFNLSQGWLGPFHIKLVWEAEGVVLTDTKYFNVIECNTEEPYLSLVTDLEGLGGEGTQELPYKFCQGSVGEIFFQVFHSELGEITFDEHLHWFTEPAAAGEFRPDFSDFVVDAGYLGVFNVTCKYITEQQTLIKTLWFKQVDCELPNELVLIVTNPPEQGEGTEANPYVYPQNPIEIGLKFLHPELGDITDNENVVWGWNPENAGEFRPQWNDFRVNNEFTGGFWISAGWPTEGGLEVRKVWIVIGNEI